MWETLVQDIILAELTVAKILYMCLLECERYSGIAHVITILYWQTALHFRHILCFSLKTWKGTA
jgi:hypothetical protein